MIDEVDFRKPELVDLRLHGCRQRRKGIQQTHQAWCKEAFAQTAISGRRIADGEAPLSRTWLGLTYAVCGDTTRARQKLAELHAIAEKRYLDPSTFASIHASLGEMNDALRYFQKALDDRSPEMVYAMVAPTLIPQLGKSAEYLRMVEKMGFPRTDK
ncbi:MAG TPA: hypothetical protein VGQ40_05425 [Chthoniobacterales bacterium]|nr:hypothetical protein [Chthoniobacterales bacterium]